MSRRLGTIVQSQAHAERFNVESPTAADILAHVEAFAVKLATPWADTSNERERVERHALWDHKLTAMTDEVHVSTGIAEVRRNSAGTFTWRTQKRQGFSDTLLEAMKAADADLLTDGWALAGGAR